MTLQGFHLAPPRYKHRDQVTARAQEPRQRLAGVSLLFKRASERNPRPSLSPQTWIGAHTAFEVVVRGLS